MTIAVRTRDWGTGSADVPRQCVRPSGMIGARRACQPAAGEDQKICTIAQESETDDQLSKTAPEHQIETGAVQCARGNGK